MDVASYLDGQLFVWDSNWDSNKARTNAAEHGVTFEVAREAFFDPFRLGGEAMRPIIPSRGSSSAVASSYTRKGDMTTKMSDRIRRRMVPDRAMVSISLRLPADLIEELKEIAPGMGFSGYQPLMRAFIGQGLRDELARIEAERLTSEQTSSVKTA